MSDFDRLEQMARALEASGEYKVVRRLRPHAPTTPPAGTKVRMGLVVDVETTGLDPLRDEIIELAMTPFTYGVDGLIFSVGESFHGLRQPREPIPSQITSITGIDDAMVAGKSIDPAEVAKFAAPAALVIAHNARFDRRFLERFCESFSTKAWACSMSQVDWASEGYEGTKLGYLMQSAGYFYDRHRAVNDCIATVALLATPLPRSGTTALRRLLVEARAATCRIWAENAPYDLKDILKARGYRWNGDPGSSPRAWYIDVRDDDRENEVNYLRAEIYRGEFEPLVRRFDAYDRFSDRV